MKIIRGIKLGGLQQKIFNLMLIFILVLIGTYLAVAYWQQNELSELVQDASDKQQAAITEVSEQTMKAVLETSMTESAALQAYIADDLFSGVRTDVQTLQTFATELFNNRYSISDHPFSEPSRGDKGTAVAQVIHEEGVNPEESDILGTVANMSEIMLAMYEASDKLDGIYVGTADGNLLYVNDRPDSYISENGEIMTLDVRNRPWYKQAAEAGELIFTGVESDAYTGISTIECAAPVYSNGRLIAVVGADIFLTDISEYVEKMTHDGGFICIVNENGQIIFSPQKSGSFKAERSANAKDIRQSDNAELASFVNEALTQNTGLKLIEIDDKEYYMAGAPVSSVGWAIMSVIDKETTDRPTAMMLENYDDINARALDSYTQGAERNNKNILFITLVIVGLALLGALYVAQRIVKPIETMTKRINELKDGDTAFEMDDVYRTNDEIEILADSFATLSKRTRDYIGQITRITAEKERIGAELSLATRIQADMLPNIYPAFPDRPEFDIYATMTPAKEVGGDFYDFFLVDDDHLCMVMADVSGKGVPAALFMMASKIILANNAMIGKSPANILSDTNSAICSNNKEEMFVTVWLGILEISTGKLTCANAGHEYPVIRHADGSFELYKDKHGFVIGGLDGAKYKEYELTLEPGSKLFVYTDGVPEATNSYNEMFGTDRMVEALNTDIDAHPKEILDCVREAVDDFVEDAEQFDDLTMLCMEYKGI